MQDMEEFLVIMGSPARISKNTRYSKASLLSYPY
jgi:hypothetical protein